MRLTLGGVAFRLQLCKDGWISLTQTSSFRKILTACELGDYGSAQILAIYRCSLLRNLDLENDSLVALLPRQDTLPEVVDFMLPVVAQPYDVCDTAVLRTVSLDDFRLKDHQQTLFDKMYYNP